MSTRAEELADQFRHEQGDVLRFVDGCSAADWQVMVPTEQSTVGVVAQHIAIGYELEIDLVQTMIAGGPPPEPLRDWDALNAMNARNAIELRQGSREEVRVRLCNGAERAEKYLRALSDEELARTAPIPLLGGEATSVE